MWLCGNCEASYRNILGIQKFKWRAKQVFAYKSVKSMHVGVARRYQCIQVQWTLANPKSMGPMPVQISEILGLVSFNGTLGYLRTPKLP